jgi:hypothetical protein
MGDNLTEMGESVNKTLIRSHQVTPLPIGPGGSNPTKQKLNDINVQLAMMKAQSIANTKYDPPVPVPITKAVTKEKFTTQSFPSVLFVVGSLLIVYGLVSK